MKKFSIILIVIVLLILVPKIGAFLLSIMSFILSTLVGLGVITLIVIPIVLYLIFRKK